MDREPGDGGAREVVHSETIRLGSSTLTASFSDWPLRADRSLDFTFEPAGGIQGRTGKLRMVSPSGRTGTVVGFFESGDEIRLPKYTRDNSVWGLDTLALTEAGTWRFEFTVSGPEGSARGTLPLLVGPRPGPPAVWGWLLGLLPWILLVPILGYAWTRTRRARREHGRSWDAI